MMTSKVKIKVGSIEVEFEGSEEYIKDQLKGLVTFLFSLSPKIEPPSSEETSAGSAPTKSAGKQLQMTTNTIIAKLGHNTNADTVLGACAYLTLVENNETFSRNDILAEVKKVTRYPKKSLQNNFSKILRTLQDKGKIIENSTNVYALTANELISIESKLNAN